MVFHQNLLEKAYFIAKMSGPTMVGRPVLTFGKRPKLVQGSETQTKMLKTESQF